MWGFQILNDGVETLGMGDFTIRKIFEITVPGIKSISQRNAGHVNDYYQITIPGYISSQCVVVITPKSYIQGNQSGTSARADLKTPTYVDLGGESIGVVRHVNYSLYENDRWKQYHVYLSSECTLEVYRIYGG